MLKKFGYKVENDFLKFSYNDNQMNLQNAEEKFSKLELVRLVHEFLQLKVINVIPINNIAISRKGVKII